MYNYFVLTWLVLCFSIITFNPSTTAVPVDNVAQNCSLNRSLTSFLNCDSDENCTNNQQCVHLHTINARLCICPGTAITSHVVKRQCYQDNECADDVHYRNDDDFDEPPETRFLCESTIFNQCLFKVGEDCMYHVQCATLLCSDVTKKCVKRQW